MYNVTICNDLWMVIIIRVHFDAADTSLDLKNKIFLGKIKKATVLVFKKQYKICMEYNSHLFFDF